MCTGQSSAIRILIIIQKLSYFTRLASILGTIRATDETSARSAALLWGVWHSYQEPQWRVSAPCPPSVEPSQWFKLVIDPLPVDRHHLIIAILLTLRSL
eukprot:1191496-Prorocentrum_minimum.AAC.3